MIKFKKMNEHGFSHHLVLAVVVLVVGIGGTYMLIRSHAASCGSVSGSSTSASATSASSTSGSSTSGSCTGSSKGWQLLASGKSKETIERVFACLDQVSSTQWTVRSLATLIPAVKDSSGYTMGITLGTSKNGGASTSHTWWLNEVTKVSASADPSLGALSVTPIISAPTNAPFLSGGGGGAVAVASLISC